jgi:hypothetical protein
MRVVRLSEGADFHEEVLSNCELDTFSDGAASVALLILLKQDLLNVL